MRKVDETCLNYCNEGDGDLGGEHATIEHAVMTMKHALITMKHASITMKHGLITVMTLVASTQR